MGTEQKTTTETAAAPAPAEAAKDTEAKVPPAPTLVEQIAALIHEDQSASQRPPTLLYKIEGCLDMAQRILQLFKPRESAN